MRRAFDATESDMTTGSEKDDVLNKPEDVQGKGQSIGRPADGELEGSAYNPLGNAGRRHWQASQITRPGLEDRGNIFFAAVEMTRMPMVVTDPNQPDNPVVFVNRAFLDLTEYAEEEVLGRNCRFLQGKDTDERTVTEVRNALGEQRAVAVDILSYKRDGKAFWNALFIGPVFDEKGKLLYWFSSQMDITRRRVSEQSFLQAQKMEAIGQLTAGLAHDFNNLLHVSTSCSMTRTRSVACRTPQRDTDAASSSTLFRMELCLHAMRSWHRDFLEMADQEVNECPRTDSLVPLARVIHKEVRRGLDKLWKHDA